MVIAEKNRKHVGEDRQGTKGPMQVLPEWEEQTWVIEVLKKQKNKEIHNSWIPFQHYRWRFWLQFDWEKGRWYCFFNHKTSKNSISLKVVHWSQICNWVGYIQKCAIWWKGQTFEDPPTWRIASLWNHYFQSAVSHSPWGSNVQAVGMVQRLALRTYFPQNL